MLACAIGALAEIDAELGLPEDGCNSTAQTISAIRELKRKAAQGESLARAVMTDNVYHDQVAK